MSSMIQRLVSVLICASLFTVAGCGKKAKAKQEAPKPQAAQQKPKPFTVKGLYVGMPIDSVAAAVREKFGGDWQVKNINDVREPGILIWSAKVMDSQKQFT